MLLLAVTERKDILSANIARKVFYGIKSAKGTLTPRKEFSTQQDLTMHYLASILIAATFLARTIIASDHVSGPSYADTANPGAPGLSEMTTWRNVMDPRVLSMNT